MEAASRRTCEKCGTPLKEREVFSLQESVYCRECYLGPKSLGPHAADYVACPGCGTTLHRFTVVCFKCHSPIREIGKVEAEVRGFGLRVLSMAVVALALIVAVVALGPVGVDRGGGTARSVALSVAGPVAALAGLFRVLFSRSLRKVPVLAGPVGLLLGGALLVGGLLMVVFLPFP